LIEKGDMDDLIEAAIQGTTGSHRINAGSMNGLVILRQQPWQAQGRRCPRSGSSSQKAGGVWVSCVSQQLMLFFK